jgi:hypothetical protein
MPQFEFLDRIVNTISLQTKPASKFKKRTASYFYDTDSLLVTKLNLSSELDTQTKPNNFFDVKSLLTKLISYSFIAPPTVFKYFNSSISIDIDYAVPEEEALVSTQIFFFSESNNYETFTYTPAYAQLNYLLNDYQPITFDNQTTVKYVNSNQSLLTLDLQLPYETYAINSAASASLSTPTYIYVQKINDDLILALDLRENLIFEYIEPTDVDEYVPPNPEDLTIITLKEFWG